LIIQAPARGCFRCSRFRSGPHPNRLASFGKIVTSLVDQVIMPPIGLLLGKVDFAHPLTV